jgi:2-polyprenyl-3-methyl-5-hydroxy-6-metoxy-1,4-benzoquinol methylase
VKESEIRKPEAFATYLRLLEEDTERFFDPSTFEACACPACSADSPQAEFTKTGFTYVTCGECGTLYCTPRPRFDDLIGFYADSPSTSYWVSDFFMPVAEARRAKIFRPRAEYVASALPDLASGTVGDVGAGFGLFLEELRAVMPGVEAVAIEPSVEQAGICSEKGLEVFPCALEELDGQDGRFDLLTAFELMEHLHDTESFLARIHALLKPGGHFLFTTLNGRGFDIALLWERSRSVSPPGHINFLNPKSAALMLDRHGFDVVETATPGRLDWDIVEGALQSGEGDPGRFFRFLAEDASDAEKAALQLWIAQSRMSSHMRVLARRR